jgi:hypothetical protein
MVYGAAPDICNKATTPPPPPQMTEPHLLQLEALCRAKGVKLLAVRSYGLMGYMRVSEAPWGEGVRRPAEGRRRESGDVPREVRVFRGLQGGLR